MFYLITIPAAVASLVICATSCALSNYLHGLENQSKSIKKDLKPKSTPDLNPDDMKMVKNVFKAMVSE